ncbi:MAG: hypothetical protein ACK5UG_09280 [Synechococcaceae cyanobacterium]
MAELHQQLMFKSLLHGLQGLLLQSICLLAQQLFSPMKGGDKAFHRISDQNHVSQRRLNGRLAHVDPVKSVGCFAQLGGNAPATTLADVNDREWLFSKGPGWGVTGIHRVMPGYLVRWPSSTLRGLVPDGYLATSGEVPGAPARGVRLQE